MASYKHVLRLLVVATYMALALVAFVFAAPAIRTWYQLLRSPVVYLPTPPSLIMTAVPTLAVLIGFFYVTRRTLTARPPSKLAQVVFLAGVGWHVLSAIVPTRQSLPLVPGSQMRLALTEMSRVLAQVRSRDGRYPVEYPDPVVRDTQGQEIRTGYTGHGWPLPFRVVPRRTQTGPALRARAIDGPGTIYYVGSPEGDRYWLTVLLMDPPPVGPARFVRNSDGTALVVSDADIDPP